ncbi:MAG: alpha/beta hydrolase [Proteobacteria bacterium]|nr:MAG: alpha/beta hydrolase [Pseudomonadota bacterium]
MNFSFLKASRVFALGFVFASCATYRNYQGNQPILQGHEALSNNWGLPTSVTRMIPYVPGGELDHRYGDLYRPSDKKIYPGILLVHGGGWNGGSPDQMKPIAQALARNGYVVYSVTYRLAPQSHFPAQVEDLVSAIRYMRSNAQQFGLDPKRVGGFGYSAGAHLINLLALGNYGEDAKLSAVVSGGTPSDLTRFQDSPLVKKLIGGDYLEKKSAWEDASPILRLEQSPHIPPTYLYHGKWDRIVPFEQFEIYRDALLKKGVWVETYEVPYLGHIPLFLFNESSVDRGIEFLNKILKRSS